MEFFAVFVIVVNHFERIDFDGSEIFIPEAVEIEPFRFDIAR